MDFRNKWLFELGQRINMPALIFDTENVCRLSFDNNKFVVIICKPAETESLLLIGQLPVSNLSINLMQQMLIANRHHCNAPIPVMSLSENLDRIQLHFKLTQLELEAGQDIIGQLLDTLEYWHMHLNSI